MIVASQDKARIVRSTYTFQNCATSCTSVCRPWVIAIESLLMGGCGLSHEHVEDGYKGTVMYWCLLFQAADGFSDRHTCINISSGTVVSADICRKHRAKKYILSEKGAILEARW